MELYRHYNHNNSTWQKLHMQTHKLKVHTHIQASHTLLFPVIYDYWCLKEKIKFKLIHRFVYLFGQLIDSLIHWFAHKKYKNFTKSILSEYNSNFQDCINCYGFYSPKKQHKMYIFLVFPYFKPWNHFKVNLLLMTWCSMCLSVCRAMLFLQTRPYWVQVINMLGGKLPSCISGCTCI